MVNDINDHIKESSNIELTAFDNRAFKTDEYENRKAINLNGSHILDIKKVMHFDDLLPLIGEFGRYQKILFLLMIPFSFFLVFVYFTQIFITLVPEEHWCRVPELEHLTVDERYVYIVELDLINTLFCYFVFHFATKVIELRSFQFSFEI